MFFKLHIHRTPVSLQTGDHVNASALQLVLSCLQSDQLYLCVYVFDGVSQCVDVLWPSRLQIEYSMSNL